MKKYLFTMSAVAMLFATSCQNDLDMPQGAGETATVAFNISTPEIATRAYSDGTTATHLQYAVYKADGKILSDLTNTAGEIHGSTTVDLKLTTGNKYTVVFWAAAEGAPYTVDFGDELAEADMTVVYDGAKSNDEKRDAFYAVKEFTVNGAMSVDVDLYRPFAQINIGTSDYADSKSAGYVPTQSAVTVKGLGDQLNFATGKVSGDAEVKKVFASADIKKDEKFPVTGYEYLAMNYVLVNNVKSLVDVEFTYKDDHADAKTRTVGSVPVQRNYRTNIYGQLLTSDVDINVTINPIYNEPDYTVFEAFENGGTVTLTEDVVIDRPLVVKAGVKAVLNLNGHNIVNTTKSDVYGEGEGIIVYGDLTINGEGIVEGSTMAVWARGNDNAVVNINSGTYIGCKEGFAKGGCSVVYASSGNTVNIYGGLIKASAADMTSYANKTEGVYAALNVADNNGMINVYGGRFYKQNPAAPGTEPSTWNAAHPNGFVAEGYGVYADGDWFEVMYTGENKTIDAIVDNLNELNEAINNGCKIIVLRDGNYGTIKATSGITYIGTAKAKIDCVNLNGADNVTLINITFDAATAKMSYDGKGNAKQYANIISGDQTKKGKGSRNLMIDGCKFTGTFANGGAAIAFTDQNRGTGQSGDITIKNCTFNTVGAYYEIYGHYFGFGKLVIENNTFKSETRGDAIYLGRYQSSTPVVLKNNVFETKATLEDAIYVQDHSNYGVSVDASGNTFSN